LLEHLANATTKDVACAMIECIPRAPHHVSLFNMLETHSIVTTLPADESVESMDTQRIVQLV
jgi:hypothetical protein